MPRPPRVDVPSIPQHVIVRGVNRQPCFHAEGDFAAFLVDLATCARQRACLVHAYVLMTNHVHLLVTGQVPGAVSKLMQSVGRRYVRRFNESWNRTGTLFQGRFRASLVENAGYLLTCMRYIELNPVRAGIVDSPFDYRWSSVHANAGARGDRLITPHEEYRRLGASDAERAAAYRGILGEALDIAEIETIRQHVNAGSAIGVAPFSSMLSPGQGGPQ